MKKNTILLTLLVTTTGLFAGGSVKVTAPEGKTCKKHGHQYFCEKKGKERILTLKAVHVKGNGKYTITGGQKWSAGGDVYDKKEKGNSASLYIKCGTEGKKEAKEVIMSFDWEHTWTDKKGKKHVKKGNTSSKPGEGSIAIPKCEGAKSDFERSPEAKIKSGEKKNSGYKTEGKAEIVRDKDGNFKEIKGTFGKKGYLGVYEGIVDSEVKDGSCYKTEDDNDCCLIDKYHGFNDGTGGIVKPDIIKINGIDVEIEDLSKLWEAFQKAKAEYKKVKDECRPIIIKLNQQILALEQKLSTKEKAYQDLLKEKYPKAMAELVKLRNALKKLQKTKPMNKSVKKKIKKVKNTIKNIEKRIAKNKKIKKAKKELDKYKKDMEKQIKELNDDIKKEEIRIKEFEEKMNKAYKDYEKARDKAMQDAEKIMEKWIDKLKGTIKHEEGHRKIAWFFADKMTEALKKFRAWGYAHGADRANELAEKEFKAKKDKIIDDIIQESEDFQTEYDSPTGSDHGDKQKDWDWNNLNSHKGLGGLL